jgi:hypothetical protein
MSGLFGSGRVGCINESDQALLIAYLVPGKALFNRCNFKMEQLEILIVTYSLSE